MKKLSKLLMAFMVVMFVAPVAILIAACSNDTTTPGEEIGSGE